MGLAADLNNLLHCLSKDIGIDTIPNEIQIGKKEKEEYKKKD